MLKDILAGLVSPQTQGIQAQQLPFQMPQMPMLQQPMPMVDPYGQQQGGLRQALMGRMMNVRL